MDSRVFTGGDDRDLHGASEPTGVERIAKTQFNFRSKQAKAIVGKYEVEIDDCRRIISARVNSSCHCCFISSSH